MTDPIDRAEIDASAMVELGHAAVREGQYDAAVSWFGRAVEAGSPEGEVLLAGLLESLEYVLWQRVTAAATGDALLAEEAETSLAWLLEQGVGGSTPLLFESLAEVQTSTPELVPKDWAELGPLTVYLEQGDCISAALGQVVRDAEGTPVFPGSLEEWTFVLRSVEPEVGVLIDKLDIPMRGALLDYLRECVMRDAEVD